MYDQVEVGHYENARYVHYSEHSLFSNYIALLGASVFTLMMSGLKKT